MDHHERYRFCPCCGTKYSPGALDGRTKSFHCVRCGYRFYQNSKPACTAVIPDSSRTTSVLLLTRAIEPSIGKLALPGGFLNYGESAVDGLRREIWEEISTQITPLKLLCCTTLDYEYLGTILSVFEAAFLVAPLDEADHIQISEEASHAAYYDIPDLLADPSQFAFPSHASVLENYLKTSRTAS